MRMLTANKYAAGAEPRMESRICRKGASTVRRGLRPVLSKLGVNQGDERQRQTRPLITPIGKPPPLAVRLAKALPFQRAQVEMRDALTVHDGLHTADGAHA